MKTSFLIRLVFIAVLLTSAGTLCAQVNVTSNSNLGIGVTIPAKRLEIWDGASARFTFSGSTVSTGYEVAQTMDNTGYRINVNNSGRNYKVAIGGVDKFKILAGENYALGAYSLASRRSGEHNLGIGYESLYKNQDGSYNVALGFKALYQNTPNPFNQDTQIKYFILENVGIAQLCIYNLQGTQIKQILITQRGEDSQWISGSELVWLPESICMH